MDQDAATSPYAVATLGSVAVIGAGVSGLTAAYRLKKEGARVTVFDAASKEGGKLRTYRANGYTWELGANTMTENDDIVGQVIDELQLNKKRLFPLQQNKRYIAKNGSPEQLPSDPISFLSTRLLSGRAKLRMLAEPLVWKRLLKNEDSPVKDESVGSFLERHIGREPVDYLVDPFVAGTSGSDPDSLSVRHAFPSLWELEQRHGSLVVGAIKSIFSQKNSKKKNLEVEGDGSIAVEPIRRKRVRGSFSFFGGMQTLTTALAERIGQEALRLGCPVHDLTCSQQENPARSSWAVSFSSPNSSERQSQRFDAVLMTAPLHSLRDISTFRDGQPYTLSRMPEVTYQPMSVMINAFRAEDVKRPLPGFGLLVPAKEQSLGLRTLGTIFSSFMFPDRAPADDVLFTTFIGGSRARELASSSMDELQQVALHDLKQLLGVDGLPKFTRHVYWKQAFPQYSRDYDKVLTFINKLEDDLPGFHYAGNHRGGLAVGSSLSSGYEAAGAIVSHLKSSGGTRTFTMAALCAPEHMQFV
eukprot:SM000205S06223  [mRNA]  locus=s205:86457:91267:+ [translate_table: standard]